MAKQITGTEIKSAREALNITQAELAEAIGVVANTVAKWENGNQKPRMSGAIRAVLKSLEKSKKKAGK
jgi:DNA-binding transcriptional regulator YiaG